VTAPRASVLLLLLALAAAIAAWSLLRRDEAEGPVDLVPGRADAPGAAPRAVPREVPEPAPVPLEGRSAAPEPVTSVDDVALVTGRVLDAFDQPVAGARVRPFRSVERVPFRGRVDLDMAGTTDATGAFAVAGLPTGAPLGLEVTHEDFAPTVHETFVVERGARDDVGTLRMRAGARLSGRVTDTAERPLAGAIVSVADRTTDHRRGTTSTPVEADTTGADGLYEVEHLAPRQYEIEVYRDGYARARRVLSLALAGGSHLENQDFELEAADLPLGGLVVDPLGTPLPDVAITVLRSRGGASVLVEETTSGADGRFVFGALPKGLYEVRAEAQGHYLAETLRLEAGELDHRVRLEPARAVTGILRADGPLPEHFEVVARPQPGTGARLVGAAGARRAYDPPSEPGRFTFGGLSLGTWRLQVLAPGYAPTTSHDVVLGTGTPRVEVVIPLRRGGTVEGRLDPPVAGARASLREADYDPSLPLESTFPTPPVHGLAAAVDEADGRFVLAHVPEGAYVLSITAPGRPPLHRRIEVFEGRTLSLGVIGTPHGASLSGTVVGPDGAARPGARVQARSEGHFAEAVSGPDGRFLFDALPPGEYELVATPPVLWEALRLQGGATVALDAGEEGEALLTLVERTP